MEHVVLRKILQDCPTLRSHCRFGKSVRLLPAVVCTCAVASHYKGGLQSCHILDSGLNSWGQVLRG